MQKDLKFDVETLKRVQVFKERYSVFPLREPYSTWVRAIRRNAGLGEKIVEYWSDDKHQYHSLGDDNKMKFGLVLCDYFREIDLDRNLYHQEEIDDFSGYVKKIQENQSFNDLFFSGVFDRVADIIHQFGVGEHGNLPALRFCHKMLTYSELEQRVSSVAKSLSEIGIHKGCLNHIETPHKHNNPIIGIYMHRSLDSIIVKLAIWRIGGAFVPIDAYDYDGTDAAICYRLNDSGARWIITAKDLKERNLNRLLKVNDDGKRWLENIEANNCLCIEDLEKNRSEARFIAPVSRNAEDTAYIMYTSGSTGNPKGVAIAQAGIQSMMSGHCEEEIGEKNKLLNENDVMAQYQSDSWDASIAELSLLSVGGCVTVVPDELKGNAPLLRAYFIQHGITAAIFTPQEFDAMGAFHTFSMLRVVYIVGDTLTSAMLRKWHDTVIKDGSKPAIEYIVNGYGLTETTVAVSIAIIKWEDIDKLDKIPIGIPFKSAVCKINNDELLVGGPCLMLGYVGDNKEKNTVKIIEFNGERYYRTNDKVSERDGVLYHDGRIPAPNANQNTNDIEIKIGSGMRVNPVDAERDLKKFVQNSRVIIIESKSGYKRLHAFIELNEPLPNEKINITIARLRREYEDSYKRHSLDHKRNEIFQWHIVNRIPTCLELIQSRNGRIIVGGLLIDELKEKISVFGNKFYFTEVGESKKADITRPDTLLDGEKIKTAQNLIQLWSNLLNVDSSQIGIDDSYDELGVCSLIGTLFMCKLTEIFPGITINRKELRDADTIRKQVDYIHRLSKEDLVKLISKKDGNNKLFLAPSLLLNYRIDYEASFVDGLKSKLGEDWGIHGLDFIQDSDKVYDFDSLIDRYISAIRKKQSNGPFHIGGLSAGSITAWLIAIKLTQRGEDVILSIYDGFHKMDDEKQVEILTDLGLHLLKKGFNVANEETEEENRKQDREKIIKAIMSVPSREELTPQGKRLLLQDRAERVFSIVMEINKNRSGENIDKTEMHISNARLFFMALQSVTINPIDALVLGIQAKDSFAQVELDKHWPVVGNKLHKRVVSGDHFSFMRNPETPSSIGDFHQYHAEKLRLINVSRVRGCSERAPKRHVFTNLSISRLNLVGSSFVNVDFINCKFIAVDFSKSTFSGCKFEGCDFYSCSFLESFFEKECNFNNSIFNYCNFDKATVNGAIWDNVIIYKSWLGNFSIENAKITNSKLLYIDLSEVQILDGVKFDTGNILFHFSQKTVKFEDKFSKVSFKRNTYIRNLPHKDIYEFFNKKNNIVLLNIKSQNVEEKEKEVFKIIDVKLKLNTLENPILISIVSELCEYILSSENYQERRYHVERLLEIGGIIKDRNICQENIRELIKRLSDNIRVAKCLINEITDFFEITQLCSTNPSLKNTETPLVRSRAYNHLDTLKSCTFFGVEKSNIAVLAGTPQKNAVLVPRASEKRVPYFTPEILAHQVSISVDGNFYFNKEGQILKTLAEYYNDLFYAELDLDDLNDVQREWRAKGCQRRALEIWGEIKKDPKSPRGPLTLASISKAILIGANFNNSYDRKAFFLFAQHNDDFRKLYQWAIIDNVVEEGKRLSVVNLRNCLGPAAIVQSNEEAQRLANVWFGDEKKDSNPIHNLNSKIRRATESKQFNFYEELFENAPSLAMLYLNPSSKGSIKNLAFCSTRVVEAFKKDVISELKTVFVGLSINERVALLAQPIVSYTEYRDSRRERRIFNLSHLYNECSTDEKSYVVNQSDIVELSEVKLVIYNARIQLLCDEMAQLLNNFFTYFIRHKPHETLYLIYAVANSYYHGEDNKNHYYELFYRLYHPETIRRMEQFWLDNIDAFYLFCGLHEDYFSHFLAHVINSEKFREIKRHLDGEYKSKCGEIMSVIADVQKGMDEQKKLPKVQVGDYKKFVRFKDIVWNKLTFSKDNFDSLSYILLRSNDADEKQRIEIWIKENTEQIKKDYPEGIVRTLCRLITMDRNNPLIMEFIVHFDLQRLFLGKPYAIDADIECYFYLRAPRAYCVLMSGDIELPEKVLQEIDKLVEVRNESSPLLSYLRSDVFNWRVEAYKTARSKAKASTDNTKKEFVRFSPSQTEASSRFLPLPLVREGVSNARPSADSNQALLKGQDFNGSMGNNNNM